MQVTITLNTKEALTVLERELLQLVAKSAVPEEAPTGLGQRLQQQHAARKAKEEADRDAANLDSPADDLPEADPDNDGLDQGAPSAPTAPEPEEVAPQGDIRGQVGNLASDLINGGQKAAVAKVLTSLGVRRVHRIADDKLAEALEKFQALAANSRATAPEGPKLPPEPHVVEDTKLEHVSLADEEDDLLGGEPTVEDAYKLARAKLDAGKRDDVKKALEAVGLRKVTELAQAQVAAFIEVLS